MRNFFYIKSKKTIFTILPLTFILIAAVSAPGAPIYDRWKVFSRGFWACGQLGEIVARNDTVYFHTGKTITALNLSSPSSPYKIGHFDNSPDEVVAKFLRKNLLYIVDSNYYFKILNVIDPSNSYLVGECSLSYECEDLCVSGNYAYVATQDGLSVVDISNPSSPSEVTTVGTGLYSQTVVADGSYLYIGTVGSGLRVFDVSTPDIPVEAGSCAIPAEIYDISISGSYAYIVTGSDSLKVIDISDPHNPVRVGAASIPDQANSIAVYGGYAYVAASWAGFLVYDVSSPTSPALVKTIPAEGFPYGVAIDGSRVYVASYREGIIGYDLTDPSNPAETVKYGVGNSIWTSAVSSGLLYVTDNNQWFRILDVSDPSNPTQIGVLRIGSSIYDLAVKDNYAFVLEADTMRVVDCSDPTSPTAVARYPQGGKTIAIEGDYAYIATGTSLAIVSIADPANPSGISSINPATNVYGVAVNGNYAYLACTQDGLKIVDISNPSSPFTEGGLDTPGNAINVAASGSYVLVADQDGGLRIINPVIPDNPVEVGSFENGGRIDDVTVSGNRAFITDTQDAMRVVDFSDPSNPVEVGYFASYGYMNEAPAVAGDIAYQTDFSYGLWVLDCSQAVETLLQNIAARAEHEALVISWEVSSEEGILFYLLSRKESGSNEVPLEIARIEANGMKRYSFTDGETETGKSYTYELFALKVGGARLLLGSVTTAAGNIPPVTLMQNFPNPFNPLTTITFFLPEEREVELTIFDASGRAIRSLLKGKVPSGEKRVIWDGTNDRGEPLSSGAYLYRLKAGKTTISKKMVLLR